MRLVVLGGPHVGPFRAGEVAFGPAGEVGHQLRRRLPVTPDRMPVAAHQQQLLAVVPRRPQGPGGGVRRQVHPPGNGAGDPEGQRVRPHRGQLGEVETAVQEGDAGGEDDVLGGHRAQARSHRRPASRRTRRPRVRLPPGRHPGCAARRPGRSACPVGRTAPGRPAGPRRRWGRGARGHRGVPPPDPPAGQPRTPCGRTRLRTACRRRCTRRGARPGRRGRRSSAAPRRGPPGCPRRRPWPPARSGGGRGSTRWCPAARSAWPWCCRW